MFLTPYLIKCFQDAGYLRGWSITRLYCKISFTLINWLVTEKVNRSKISIITPHPQCITPALAYACAYSQLWSWEKITTVSFKRLDSHAASKMFICWVMTHQYYGWDLPSSQTLTRMLVASFKSFSLHFSHSHVAIASPCFIPRKTDVRWCNFLNNHILNMFGV